MAQRYQVLIKPWAIYRSNGLVTNVCVARFKSRSDAEGHLSLLRRTGQQFELLFDPHSDIKPD
jgi:hypothetical protein